MPLETATYINQLVPSNPTSTDAKSQGDDHLRLLKQTLQNTFPGMTGVVAATSVQLGYTGAIRTSWATAGSVNMVVGQLAWRQFNNNHTIIDVSNGFAPDGVTAVNKTDAVNGWTPGYPVLMGWNGTATSGVRVDSAAKADNAIGTGQTWTNLTASRALATTYTNTTGRAIGVIVNIQSGGAGGNASFNVNGLGIAGSFSPASDYRPLFVIIPPGQTYSLTATGYAINNWQELR